MMPYQSINFRKHHVAGPKRWWILQKTLRFALFCLPILQLLYFTSPSVVDGLALRSLRRLSILKSAPRQWSLLNKLQIVSSDGGGALIIDYGKDGIVSDSLQAIRKHKFVHILDDPGSADLSAYVDFASIRHSALEASDDISVHGPMTQSQFLGSLGINFRVEALLQNCTEEQAESLRTGYWRLVGDGEAPFWEGPEDQTPIGMGTRYLAMAIVNKKQGTPVPFE